MKNLGNNGMIGTADFYNGLNIEIDGEVWTIVEFQHRRSAQGQAFLKTKLKNLETGQVIEKTFKSGEVFKEPQLEIKKAEYLYSDGENYYFMDKDNYEQILIPEEKISSIKNFLKENILVEILFHNSNIIDIKLPIFVELKVIETEPGLRGDTVSAATKPAKIETNAVLQVPLFIQIGDIIKVDTRDGKYVERIK